MALKSVKLNLPRRSGAQDLLGIDINDENLKVVHARVSKLKREVVQLASQEVHGLTDDDIAAVLQKTLSALRLGPVRTFLTVPLHVVITRTIEIPSRDLSEIREIVNLQASRHTPYARSEIIVDMLNLGVVRDSYTKVLLVIVPKDAVVRQTRILEKLGLPLEKVFFSPEGICQACSKILGNESNDTVTGIVHMDAGFTTLEVVQRGRILFIRGIAVGANHLFDERELHVDRFVDELQKSLDSYLAEELGPMPSTLLLTGVIADVTDLDEIFQETLHIPLKHQAYFNHFSISGPARQTASAAKRVSFFDVAAPLLLFDQMRVNLIPEERRLQLQIEERGRQMVKTGVLMMLVLTLVFAVCLEKIYFKNEYLERLRARYNPVREDARHLEQLDEKSQVVKDYLAGRGESLGTLVELYETLPKDVRLSGIKYEDGERFSVKGTSTTMASVFAFVANLEKSNKFKSVKTKYVTTRNENGLDVADFEILASIAAKKPAR